MYLLEKDVDEWIKWFSVPESFVPFHEFRIQLGYPGESKYHHVFWLSEPLEALGESGHDGDQPGVVILEPLAHRELELETKVHEVFTITEKAPTIANCYYHFYI